MGSNAMDTQQTDETLEKLMRELVVASILVAEFREEDISLDMQAAQALLRIIDRLRAELQAADAPGVKVRQG